MVKKKSYIRKSYIHYKMQKRRIKLDKVEATAWLGTSMLFFGPYLLKYQIGFILNACGIMLLTPQVIRAKQWNLVLLNIVSSTGYWLQIFNII